MRLIIVESPTKALTLSRFLTDKYQVLASMGHLRDLPKKELGIEIEKNFKPTYVTVPGKHEAIDQLKQASKKASQVILATDLDREGEAIAYHIGLLLKKPKFSRITFHEITKSAIQQALKTPGSINMRLVRAQQGRRVLDRLVGYKLSPLLWKKIRRGLSAGRVQSVAVRLIAEREKEIKDFDSKAYWTIEAILAKAKKDSFSSQLVAKNDKKYEKTTTLELFAGSYTYKKTSIASEKQAKGIIGDLKKQSFRVAAIDFKQVQRQPSPPFTTSSLQQTANRYFGFSAKKTMQVAQKLYERGYITYHRTDSIALASQAISKIREFIKETYSEKYLPSSPRIFKTKSKTAQEAHEAIRPTRVKKRAQDLSARLRKDETKLYTLIHKRAVACQMAPALIKQTNLQIGAGSYSLQANGVQVIFPGFLKLYPKRLKDRMLPELEVGDKLKLQKVTPEEHQTQVPPRYNEASLIKILESKGIGRPSTYAPVVSVIQTRQYVEKKEGVFHPTAVGLTVNDFLVKHFGDIVAIPFTAQLEEDLDKIAKGEKKWQKVIGQFYRPFAKKLAQVVKTAKRAKIKVEKIGKKCPECKKGEQVIRLGRFGKFLSCSRFPDCKWKDVYKEKVKGVLCPDCKGDIVIRRTKKGKQFYGCINWPKCKWASWRQPRPSRSKRKA